MGGSRAAVLLGLRASGVTDRVLRDLDDNGQLPWIEFGTTRRARRRLEVPALLRPYLLALAKGRAPDAQLPDDLEAQREEAGSVLARASGCARRPVYRWSARSRCEGLHASVATEAGATSHVVASRT